MKDKDGRAKNVLNRSNCIMSRDSLLDCRGYFLQEILKFKEGYGKLTTGLLFIGKSSLIKTKTEKEKMKKVSGRCYYKMTVNGNLLGEYSNYEEGHGSARDIYAESATRYEGNVHDWVGKYYSAWWECTCGKRILKGGILEITACSCNAKLFTITWTEENGSTFMWGEAMLCDDILVVDYNNNQ